MGCIFICKKKGKEHQIHQVIVKIKNYKFQCSVNRKVKVKSLSCVQFFVTPWTVACQASLSMGFSRQEYWSGMPFPSPGDLPNPGIKPRSPASRADPLPSMGFYQGSPYTNVRHLTNRSTRRT